LVANTPMTAIPGGMNRTNRGRLILFALCVLWSGTLAEAQPLNRIDLTRRTLTIDVSNGSVEDVLIVLATEHRVPIGFERSGLYQKQITVQLVRVSLKIGRASCRERV